MMRKMYNTIESSMYDKKEHTSISINNKVILIICMQEMATTTFTKSEEISKPYDEFKYSQQDYSFLKLRVNSYSQYDIASPLI